MSVRLISVLTLRLIWPRFILVSHLDTALSSHEGLHVLRLEALYDVLELDVLVEDVEAFVLPFLNENNWDRGYVVEVAHLSVDAGGSLVCEVIEE